MSLALQNTSVKPAATTVVPLCFIVAFLEGFDLQAAGIAAPRLAPDLGLDARMISLFFISATLGIILGAFLGGRLSDRLTRKSVLFASVALFGLGCLACGLATRIDLLLVARFVTGIGLGGALPNLVAIAAQAASPDHRNLTITIMHAGLPIGTAAASIYAMMLATNSWRPIFLAGGITPLVILPLILMFVREPERPVKAASKVSVMAALSGDGRTIATGMLWLAFVATLLIPAVLVYWLPTLMISSGLSQQQAFIVQCFYGIFGAVGSLSAGALMDRLPRNRVIGAIFAATAIALVIMGTVPSAFALSVLLGALVGVLTSAGQASIYALAPGLYPPEFRGTGVGAGVGVGRIGTILGPLLAGGLVASGHSTSFVLLSMAPIAVVGGLVAVGLAHRISRREVEAV